MAGSSVLIAGCGYLGLRVAQRLVASGARVFCITRSAERASLLAGHGLLPIVLSLGDEDPWPILPTVDALIWLVGFDQKGSRQAVWVHGLERLLASLSIPPKRIIYGSSVSVYGDAGGAIVDEASPTLPTTEGGMTCVKAEALLSRFASGTGIVVTSLRLAGLYGPARLLRSKADIMSGMVIRSPGDEWLNLVHIDDATQSILDVGELDSPAVLNVVGHEPLLRRDYYEELSRLLGAPAPTFTPTEQRERSGSKRVISNFRKSLGIHFRFDDARAGLIDAVARTYPEADVPIG